MENLFHLYVVRGGVMMIALIPCLVLMVAFMIQGCLNLRRRKVCPKGFAQELRMVREGKGMEGARAFLEDENHSLAEIIRHVDAHLGLHHEADAAEVLREEIEDEIDLLLQQNSQLGMLYRIGPLMGLLGTVFGMIKTFNDFAASGNPEVQQLSQGINVALITTAWGLGIAIPSYIVFYLFQRKIASYEQLVLPREGAEAVHALLDRPMGRLRGAISAAPMGD